MDAKNKVGSLMNTDLKSNVQLLTSSFISNDILTIRYIKENGSLKYCVCYIDGLVNRRVLDELNKRLNRIPKGKSLDLDNIIKALSDKFHFPIKTIDSTRALNVVLKRLVKGKIVLLVEGYSIVLTLPYLFCEHFQDDLIYQDKFSKYVNLVSHNLYFAISISLPAIFVAMILIHQNLLSQLFLINLAIEKHRLDFPLPTIVNAIVILLLFDLFYEVMTRIKNERDQASYSILILLFVYIAIRINVLQASLVTVIGIADICGAILPKLKYEIIITRYILFIMAISLGLLGFTAGILLLLILLMNSKSFGLSVLRI